MVKTNGPYPTYAFRGKDPIINQLRELVDAAGVDYADVSNVSGVGAGTLRSWFTGKTKRPQFATASAVAGALHHELQLRKRD